MDMPADILSKIQGMATNAAKPENSEPGPGDVGPSLDTKADQAMELVTLAMDEAEVKEWKKRIQRSEARIKAREEKWDLLLKEYLPVVSASGTPETVKVQRHFRNAHSKIGQLFYRSPELILEPKDPGPAQNIIPNPMGPMAPPLSMEDIISVKQAVLNAKLGRDGIKGNRLMDELLFDVLVWAGIGCAKLGYRCVFKTIQKPVLVPDPNFVPNPGDQTSILGLGAPPPQPPMVPKQDPLTGQPVMQDVPVPVYEEWYMRRFSPKKLLVNDDLKSTRYDEDATFMGMRFFMSPKQAMARFKLTEEQVSKCVNDDRVFEHEADKQDGSKAPGLVSGVELFVKASIFTDEVHPLALNQLVFLDGIEDRPVVWRPSPDQEFDPNTGQLTENSLIGFPTRVLTIRDLADSPFPEADAAFTNSEIKQLSTWRRQSIKIRDAAIGKYFYDKGAFDDSEVDLLKNGDIGVFIGVNDGRLAQGADKIFTTAAQIHQTQDDYRGAQAISNDIDETLGISSTQAGVPTNTVRTATEINDFKAASNGRSEKERERVVDFWLDAARMIDQLLMRYATANEYVHITGEDGARRMQMWNNQMITGKYLYDIAPDSQMKADSEADWNASLALYNMAAPDPMFNRAYVLRRMARMRGYDPAKVVLNPVQQMAQPPHGGTSGGGDVVNKHQASNSGKMPNGPNQPNHRETMPQ